MKQVTKAQARRLMREWQKRLRLQDWRIRFLWETVEDPKRVLTGQSDMNSREKVACISVWDPKLFKKPQDPMELTIIHELLHLHMISFEPEKPSREGLENMEAAIDSIAWALLQAKYQDRVVDYYSNL